MIITTEGRLEILEVTFHRVHEILGILRIPDKKFSSSYLPHILIQ